MKIDHTNHTDPHHTMATFSLPEAWQCGETTISYPKVDKNAPSTSIYRLYVETSGYDESIMSLRKAYMLENPHYGDYLNEHVNNDMGGLNVAVMSYFSDHILSDVIFKHPKGTWGFVSNALGYPFNFCRITSLSKTTREIFFCHKLYSIHFPHFQ